MRYTHICRYTQLQIDPSLPIGDSARESVSNRKREEVRVEKTEDGGHRVIRRMHRYVV